MTIASHLMPTILLIEGNPYDRELTLRELTGSSHGNELVASVRDGMEALDYLHRRGPFRTRAPRNPAMILLDIYLPRLSGLELISKIKAEKLLRTIPIVILTTSHGEQRHLEQECSKFGQMEFLPMPLRWQEFCEVAKRLKLSSLIKAMHHPQLDLFPPSPPGTRPATERQYYRWR